MNICGKRAAEDWREKMQGHCLLCSWNEAIGDVESLCDMKLSVFAQHGSLC